MKIYDPDTIRNTCLKNAALPKPDEFSPKARGAVRTVYNSEIAKLPGVIDKDEARYWVWGFVLAPSDEPFHPLRSDDLLPQQFNALGLWATERVGGEYRIREGFPEELAQVLTKARAFRNRMEAAAYPETLGDMLAEFRSLEGPFEIEGRTQQMPDCLPGFVGYTIQRGGYITETFIDDTPVKALPERPTPVLGEPAAGQGGEYDPGF